MTLSLLKRVLICAAWLVALWAIVLAVTLVSTALGGKEFGHVMWGISIGLITGWVLWKKE
jgi:hypothetical protein